MSNKKDIQEFIRILDIENVVLLDNYNSFYKVYFSNTKNVYSMIKNSTLILDDSFRMEFAEQYNKLRNNILEIYRYYVKGDILRASTKMNNILFRREYNGKKFYKYFLASNGKDILYRCRQGNSVEVKDILKNIHDKMFHIAFNKRNLIGNCRFSISGFPCLYLGSSVECCKKEIGIEKGKDQVICSYRFRGNFPYYDLTLNSNNVSNIEDLKIYLLKSLIVQAVSYTIDPVIKKQREKQEPESDLNKKSFLTYYVIPQLITAAIASRGVKTRETQCIRYRSVKFLNNCNQYNYVFIPRIRNFKTNQYYDEDLYEKFEIALYKEVKEKELVGV